MNRTETLTLTNGLRIVLDKNHSLRTCAFGVMISSGSGYETPETAGISHFIEHMLFRGTQRRSALDLAVEMDEIGGRVNAYTTSTMTYFYAHTLTEHLPKALDIICDILTASKLDEADIELEKGVIKEEIAMYKDSPEDLCADTYYEHVWKGSMLASNILGTEETVDGITREMLVSHLKKFYVPERMIVSFSGNFDEKVVLGICEKYFGNMKNTGFETIHPTAVYHPEFVTVEKDFSQNQLILGFEGVPVSDRDGCRISTFVASILSGGSSSKLFQTLREKLGLVYSVDCSSYSHKNTGLLMIDMGLSRNSEEKALMETVKILSDFSNLITEKDVSVAKEHIVSGFVMGCENVSARASRNARSIFNYGCIESDDSKIASLRSVTAEQIRDCADKIMNLKRISLCAVGNVHTADEYRKFLSQKESK